MATYTDRGQRLDPRPYPALLSLVFPIHNEGDAIPHLRVAVTRFLDEVHGDAEVILVNDGSRDSTLEQICQWAEQDQRIKIVGLSRNFGHQSAATAGLDYASGDAVVLLDADLQDPLSTVHQMIDRYCEGYDVAYGKRVSRKGDSAFKRVTAWAFYRLMQRFVYPDLPADTGDFRMISRKCLSGLQRMRETHRFLRGMVAWVGYSQIEVPYQRIARVAGETKYPLRKMLRFAWVAATSFSARPLKIATFAGLIVMLLGVEEGVRAIMAHIFGWYTVPGWASLTVLVSLLGGATLISIGALGEYVGKIYEQSKNRPIYLVAQTINCEPQPLAEDLGPATSLHKAAKV